MEPSTTVRPRVLCVDDEQDLLASLRMSLGRRYEVITASNGDEALALLDEITPPVDVVVSDMRMPGMNGATLLTAIRHRHPDIPRLLLTGQADVESTIASINEAKVFRFLTKPCPQELLIEAIEEAVDSSRLRNIERELLDRTLSGTVDLLTGVLGLVCPEAVERSGAIREGVRRVCHALERPVSWDLDLAAMLSQIGFVVLTANAVLDPSDSEVSTLEERRIELAAELLMRIPRLEGVAALVRNQLATEPVRLDDDPSAWSSRELNAEILRLVVRFEQVVAEGTTPEDAVAALLFDTRPPPAFLLEALSSLHGPDRSLVAQQVSARDLRPGMVLAADLVLSTGPVLAPEGMELSAALIGRVQSFARTSGVTEPIDVLAPMPTERAQSWY